MVRYFVILVTRAVVEMLDSHNIDRNPVVKIKRFVALDQYDLRAPGPIIKRRQTTMNTPNVSNQPIDSSLGVAAPGRITARRLTQMPDQLNAVLRSNNLPNLPLGLHGRKRKTVIYSIGLKPNIDLNVLKTPQPTTPPNQSSTRARAPNPNTPTPPNLPLARNSMPQKKTPIAYHQNARPTARFLTFSDSSPSSSSSPPQPTIDLPQHDQRTQRTTIDAPDFENTEIENVDFGQMSNLSYQFTIRLFLHLFLLLALLA